MTIEEFLEARALELVMLAEPKVKDSHEASLAVLAAANMQLIIEWHKNWPILVETEPELETDGTLADPNDFVMRMTKQMNWLTQEEYVKRFGTKPPTAPLLRQMVQRYSWHPDFDPSWEI